LYRFLAAGDLDSFAEHKRVGNFPAGFVKIAPRGFAGDPESGGCLFLFKPFEIDKPEQFQFVRTQRDALAPFIRAAAGLVTTRLRIAINDPTEARATPPVAEFCGIVLHQKIPCIICYFFMPTALKRSILCCFSS
jgi:hypothetical protein